MHTSRFRSELEKCLRLIRFENSRKYKSFKIKTFIGPLKEAQNLLVKLFKKLDQEEKLLKRKDPKRIALIEYQRELLCSMMDSLVWTISVFDRNKYFRVFKNRRYGDVRYQNIRSALDIVKRFRKNQNVLAIPLDLCSWAPITDMLIVKYKPGKPITCAFLELKEGKINDAISKALEKGEKQAEEEITASVGTKGLKQLRRVVRQVKIAKASINLFHGKPGTYSHPLNEENDLSIVKVKSHDTYDDDVKKLILETKTKGSGSALIDTCIKLIGIQQRKPDTGGAFINLLDQYYLSKEDDANSPNKANKLNDWRAGLYSIFATPFATSPLDDQDLFDILFGRTLLGVAFFPDAFISLCQKNGLDAYWANSDEVPNSRKSGAVSFDRRIICFRFPNTGWIFSLAYGTYHSIIFGWLRPISAISQIKDIAVSVANQK